MSISECLSSGISNIIESMNFKSKYTPLIILGISSVLCSRSMFYFIDDPEGPNLLVVFVMASIIYFLSSTIYKYGPFPRVLKKIPLVILLQLIVTIVFYFLLK